MIGDSGEHETDLWEVEERNGWFFVVNGWRGVELAPVFDYMTTAEEVMAKFQGKYPFFSEIPTVPYGCAYPRPNRIMPKPFPRRVRVTRE